MNTPEERRSVMIRNVRANAGCQRTPQNMENYLRSCEAHGGELAEIAQFVRGELVTVGRLLEQPNATGPDE